MMKKIAITIYMCIIISIILNIPSYVLAGGLKEKIQAELDGNPFLQKENIKLRVIEEQNGYVTIEMYEGDRKIRRAINEGIDIEQEQQLMQFLMNNSDLLSSANALRKSLIYIRKMDDVKEILLTAIINTPLDKGDELYGSEKYQEAIPFYLEAAKNGSLAAQRQLGNIFVYILDNMEEGLGWYCQAADEGDRFSQYEAAWIYATAKEQRLRDGAKAVAYALKAVAQFPNDTGGVFDVLAAAYARNNEFEKAVTEQEKAISLMQVSTKHSQEQKQRILKGYYERLQLYKSSQAYVEK